MLHRVTTDKNFSVRAVVVPCVSSFKRPTKLFNPIQSRKSIQIAFAIGGSNCKQKIHFKCDGRYIDLKGVTSQQYFIFCGLCMFNWEKANADTANTSLLGFKWPLLWGLNLKWTFHRILSVNVLHATVYSLSSVFGDNNINTKIGLRDYPRKLYQYKKTPIKAILAAHPKWLYFQGYGRVSLVQKPSHNPRTCRLFTQSPIIQIYWPICLIHVWWWKCHF